MPLTRAQSRQNLKANAEEPALSNGYANGGSDIAAKQPASKQEQETKVQPAQSNGHVLPPYDPSPKSTSYEFLGPPGALGISVLVPFFTYFFAFGCDERGCPSLPFLPFMSEGLKQMGTLEFWTSLYDSKAMLAYLAWYAWCVLCWAVLPGKWLEGSAMRNGEKLWYKINAFPTFVATMVATASVGYVYGRAPFLFFFDHWIGMISASLIVAATQVRILHIRTEECQTLML